MNAYRYKTGVTLIEILIALAIMSILVSLVLGIAGSIQRQNSDRLTRGAFALLKAALEEYRSESAPAGNQYQADFPVQDELDFANPQAQAQEQVLTHSEFLFAELQGLPACRGLLQKLDDSLIRVNLATGGAGIFDGWGTPLEYRYIEQWTFPELISAGPDRLFGTIDDITSR